MDSPIVAHALVTAAGRTPTRWLLFLHGVFGTGANFRSFARRVVEARPAWGAVLVDLRKHGASQGLLPPHTVATAAEDLRALSDVVPGPIEGIVGHSFGGKVALAYVAAREGDLDVAFILDAMPGPRPTARGSEMIPRVLAALEEIGPVVASREAFIDAIAARGITRELGQWLAMNLRAEDGQYRSRLDLDAIRELLADYWHLDLFPVIESPPGRVVQHVVLGGRSDVFSASDRARIDRAATAHPERVRVTVLPEAGHWVHVDDPDLLFRVIVESL